MAYNSLQMMIRATFKSIIFLTSANPDDLHDFELQACNLLRCRVVRKIHLRALKVTILFLSHVDKRYVVPLQHQCVSDPVAAVALDMTDNLYRIQLVQLLVFLQ